MPQFTKHDLEAIKIGAVIVGAITAIFLVGTYIIEPFTVNGISMQPTLHTGDVVLVWRWPQTWASITNSQYIPARSNLVVIQKTPVSGEALIKRVIGLPGDSVSIGNNVVTITNPQNPAGFDPDTTPYGKDLTLTDGVFNTQVGSGQIFVLGDNRTPGASIDSRSNLGNVSSNIIIGKVVIRIFPFTQADNVKVVRDVRADGLPINT